MRKLTACLFLLTFFVTFSSINAQFEDLLKTFIKSGSSSISPEKAAQGLKEALEVGTNNAVGLVSALDGYYKNDLIKIPLPDDVRNVEKIAKKFGLGKKFDEFEESLNRAAEKAAKSATPIFLDAIKSITFSDALKILNGRENEATLFFQGKTESALAALFKPIIKEAMDNVGVTKLYKNITGKISKIPFVSIKFTDLDQYVTNKALDGLYKMIAEEEKKIRKDPAARISDILKDVFGGEK